MNQEFAALARSPYALAILGAFLLGVLWLIDGTTNWSAQVAGSGSTPSPARHRDDARPDRSSLDRASAAKAAARARSFHRGSRSRAGVRGADGLYGDPDSAGAAVLLVFKLLSAMGFMVSRSGSTSDFGGADRPRIRQIGLALSIAGGIAVVGSRPNRHFQEPVDTRPCAGGIESRYWLAAG